MRVFTKDKADDFNPNYKFSFETSGSRPSTPSSSPLRSLSPLQLISRKSFSYGKLPLEPIRLTVLKLDGSSFDITVAKNPTLAHLKQGVEDAFNHLPQDGTGHVSWSHVWAQFCLCFNGQKLLSDQDNVAIRGIKDGDQLEFARHRSICYNLANDRPKKRDHHLQESTTSANNQEAQRQEEGNNLQDNSNQQNKGDDDDENENNSGDDIAVNITCYCSWAHLWKRLFTHPNKTRRDTNYAELA